MGAGGGGDTPLSHWGPYPMGTFVMAMAPGATAATATSKAITASNGMVAKA